MGLLRLAGFGGMWPALDSRALPDNAAASAVNTRAGGGMYLKPLAAPVSRQTMLFTTRTIFPIPTAPTTNVLASGAHIMQFSDVDTDVVRGPLINDAFERYYWASPTGGLRYAPKSSIILGSTGFEGGVPAPTAAATLDAVAGTGTEESPMVTRAYVTTFINAYGEESAPSPPVEATGRVDGDWLVTAIQQPGSPGARAAYQTIRLYRTVTALSGVTSYYKVVDLAVGTTFYMDRLSDLQVSAQGEMQSTFYDTPPSDIEGLVSLPNGILMGWADNLLYFSENYRPSAWPAAYQMTVDFPVVGIGVFGNTAVVCTEGNVFLVSGTKSAALTLTKTDAILPCLSRGSIVSAPEGVYFASEQGLVLVSPGGIRVVTEELFTREQWVRDYQPGNIRAMYFRGEYVAAWLVTPTPLLASGFRFRPADPSKTGVVLWTVPQSIFDIGVEPWTGKPFLVGQLGPTVFLYELEEPSDAGGTLSYTWRSKEIVYPQPTNFSIAQAYFDDSAGQLCHIKIWATLRGHDGSTSRVLVYEADTAASGREFRLPSGFLSDIWQVEFTGTTRLQSFLMATSVAELRGA